MTSMFRAASLAFAAAIAIALPASAGDLIPRKDIFGNPERTQVRVSPDGKWLSFLAPKDGVMNVWIAPVAEPKNARAITEDKKRGIRQHFWAQNSRYVLYLQDNAGDENFLLYATGVDGGGTRNLTPLENTRVIPIAFSTKHRDEVLVGLNDRDPTWHDVWKINVETGERTLVYQNEGIGQFIADDDLNLRIALTNTPDGGFLVQKIGGDGSLSDFYTIPGADALTTAPIAFDASGTVLYAINSIGRDKSALVTLDLETAEPTVIGEHPKADVSDIIIDPKTHMVQAFGAEYLKQSWTAIDPAIEGDLDFIASRATGSWQIMSRSDDDSIWVVYHDPVTEPAYYWVYDRAKKSLSKEFVTRPQLAGRTLAPMYPREIPARDGLTLVSYLTLPVGTDANGDGKPDAGPLPLILNVHGGPWARDSYGYDSEHQWLANRGYAVLSVNYRGSTGFGKNFTNAGDLEWGRKMHEDLMDAVQWTIDQGIAKADEIAIYGGSYGGYATLVGVTMTPTRFACGVDIVGPSNLETLLATIPPYWKSFFETMAKRIGDPRTEEGKALLKARSPLTHTGNIQRPLLIAQGANDPRVKQAESDQIVAAMKAKNIPVTYVLYPEEGHGFAEPANRTSFYAISEAFLSGCLGGAYEPIGGDFEGARLEVREGASHVPGLEAALAE